MKNIKFLFLALATLAAGAFTACQEDWNPGPADSELSVYLPVDQDVAAFYLKDNEEAGEFIRVARFPVYRQNAGNALTVEFRSRFLDATKIFKLEDEREIPIAEAFKIAESVTFEKGKTVAYLEINLHEDLVGALAVGKYYQAEIMVKDAKYHGNYGLYRKVINIGISEIWASANVNYKEGSTEELSNVGYLFDDFIAPLYGMPGGNGAPVVIEQSVSRPGYYRMVNAYSEENVVAFIGGIPADMSFAKGDVYTNIDATNPEEVVINYVPENTGMYIEGFGNVEIATLIDSTTGEAAYGKLEDGIITFPKNAFGVVIDGAVYDYANQSGLYRIVLPGVDLTDYSMAVAFLGTETSQDNSETIAIINFAVGADVTSFRFVAVEGKVPAYSTPEKGDKEDDKEAEKKTRAAEGELHEAIVRLLDDEYKPTEEDTMATATPSQTSWYLTFDEAGVYTVFAVPYNKDNEPVLDEIASTFFYYRPATSTDVAPTVQPLEMVLDSAENLIEDSLGSNVDWDEVYNPTFILACDLNHPEVECVSGMVRYFDTTEAIDKALADGKTIEKLLASKDAVDSADWLQDMADNNGKTQMIMQQLEPDTEYTMLMAVKNIYGGVDYFRADGKTAPYAGVLNIGIYEFIDGDSSMKIKFAPFFAANYAQYYMQGEDERDGQMYLLTWIGDEIAPEKEGDKPVELKFYSFYMPAYNTLVCYGQEMNNQRIGFGMGIAEYDGPNEKVDYYWGYYSSSTEDFEYNNEAMVIALDDEGGISGLETYFQKYYYYYTTETVKDKDGKDVEKSKYNEEILASFSPKTTTVKLVESHMPEVPATPESPKDSVDNTDDTSDKTDGTTENTEGAKKASVGQYNGAKELKVKQNSTKTVTASVCIE